MSEPGSAEGQTGLLAMFAVSWDEGITTDVLGMAHWEGMGSGLGVSSFHS